MHLSIRQTAILWMVIAAVCIPASAHAQSRKVELPAKEVYTNKASHFQFPPMVADFIREPEFTQFDAEARDVGVGYNNLFRGIAVTVFVYPVAVQPPDDTLKGHFGTCKAQVQRKHSDAKQVFEGKVQVTPGGRKHEGLQAVFTFTDVFAGKRQPVRSELYLFTHRQFFLCFRVTYVVGSQAKAEPDIKAFIDGLAWPEEQMRNQILKTTSR